MTDSSATKEPVSSGNVTAGVASEQQRRVAHIEYLRKLIDHVQNVAFWLDEDYPEQARVVRYARNEIAGYINAIYRLDSAERMNEAYKKALIKDMATSLQPVTLCFESEEEARFIHDSNQWPSAPAETPEPLGPISNADETKP